MKAKWMKIEDNFFFTQRKKERKKCARRASCANFIWRQPFEQRQRIGSNMQSFLCVFDSLCFLLHFVGHRNMCGLDDIACNEKIPSFIEYEHIVRQLAYLIDGLT